MLITSTAGDNRSYNYSTRKFEVYRENADNKITVDIEDPDLYTQEELYPETHLEEKKEEVFTGC